MKCRICKKELVGPFPAGIKEGSMCHFDCMYEEINGKKFDWKDIKPRKKLPDSVPKKGN